MQRDKLVVLVVVAALFAVALVGVALVAPSGAVDGDSPADRTVSVGATGTADAQPDQAVIRVAATAEGDDPAAVRDALATESEALRENLATADVAEDDYETTEYRIRGQRRPPEERDGPAYEGVHAIEVTLSNTSRAGAVVDAAADAGAEVGHLEFTLSEDRRTELRETAIDAAMADARTQADALADSGGLRVTDVATVDATQPEYRPVRYDAAETAASDGASTEIDTGEVSVSYEVRVTYNATVA